MCHGDSTSEQACFVVEHAPKLNGQDTSSFVFWDLLHTSVSVNWYHILQCASN